jgi:hypothetical protein
MTTNPARATARVATRRKRVAESFSCASECIGQLEKGCSLFAITRGQFSMIDAALACLDQVGRSKISLWTWTVAEYEIECLERLRIDGRISHGTMIIDSSARIKNRSLIQQWQRTYGSESVRYVLNHAKVFTIESESGFKLLLRGSMNLNYNPRFEQFDLTEGGADFDLVREIEESLPLLPDDCKGKEVYKASKVSAAFDPEQLELFSGVKTWAK